MSAQSIGALRHRLTLESLATSPDGGGGVDESWIEAATLWGEITPLAGGETAHAERLAGRHTYEIRIRYRAGVVPAMRLRLGTRVFHILAVENVGERNRWLKLVCEERAL